MDAPGTRFPVARLAEDLPAVGVRDAYLALDADEAAERYAADAAEALRAVAARLGGRSRVSWMCHERRLVCAGPHETPETGQRNGPRRRRPFPEGGVMRYVIR